MSIYYAFRVFLVENNQRELFKDSRFGYSKKESFKAVFNKIRKNEKVDFYHYNSRYIIYYLKAFSKSVYLFELAREKVFTKLEEGDKRIEDVQDYQYPYIFLLVDMERQILLIEHKSTIFQEIQYPKNILERFIEEKMNNDNLLIKVNDISSVHTFWESIETAESIYKFNLTLTGPNIFGGRFPASELVRNLKDEYNSTETKFSFKNISGKLKLLKENLDEYIRLASSGAGKYLVELKDKNGQRDRITESSNTVKRTYEDIEKEDSQDILNDLEEIDKTNE